MEKKSFFDKYKIPIIIGGCFIILLVVVLFLLLGKGKTTKKGNVEPIDKNSSIEKVYSLIEAKYDDLEEAGEYFLALSGDSLTGTIHIINKDGKKLGSINLSKIDPKIIATLDIEEITDNYYIVSYSDLNDFKTVYIAYSYSNKELVKADDIEALTDNYFVAEFETEDGDIESIYTSKGKEVYKNVKYPRAYNNTYITFEQNDVSKVIDNSGKELLSGYDISKVVTDDNDNIKYLIVENETDDVYNYYDIKTNTKKGDAFNYYTVDSKTGNIIITKKVNSTSTKFILNDNGEQTEYIEEEKTSTTTKSNYYEDIKDKIDLEKYSVFADTVKSATQNYILVNNNVENKFGILDIAKGEFTELGIYQENSSKRLTLKMLTQGEGNTDVYFNIICSTYYCDTKQQFIYNFTDNKLIISRVGEESSIDDIYIYDGYTVIKDGDSGLYLLLDKDGKQEFESKQYIYLLGKKVNYYTSYLRTEGTISLYDTENKKVVNSKTDGVYSISTLNIDDKKIRYFNSEDKINFITDEDKINSIEGVYQSHDDNNFFLVSNNGKKLNSYNISTGKLASYTLGENESSNGSNGKSIAPYRNAFFINNSSDMTMKIVNAEGKNLLSQKNMQIYKISKNEDGSVYVYVKNNADKIGIYVAK